jgi:pimeloyl-ACP methyl ester carboxylesterase
MIPDFLLNLPLPAAYRVVARLGDFGMSLAAPGAGKIKPNRPLRRFAWRALRLLLITYALVLLLMFLFQTQLIFPGARTQGTSDAAIRPGAGEALVPLQAADGTALMGLFCEAELPPGAAVQPRPTVLHFYGNGECMAGATFASDRFRAMGCHVMLVDYAGYGLSSGKPSEQGCYAAAEAAYHYVLTRPDVDKSRLISAGWSLGGTVAVELAHRHRNDKTFCALMTFSSFTSVVDVASHIYPFLPVSLIIQHRFPAGEKMRDLSLPYFNGHGRRDNIIPFAQSDALIRAYGNPRNITRYISDKASHNDFFDEDALRLDSEIASFLARATQ